MEQNARWQSFDFVLFLLDFRRQQVLSDCLWITEDTGLDACGFLCVWNESCICPALFVCFTFYSISWRCLRAQSITHHVPRIRCCLHHGVDRCKKPITFMFTCTHGFHICLYTDVDSFTELDQTVVSESGAIRSCTDNLWASFLMVCKARLQWVSRCHMKWLPEGSWVLYPPLYNHTVHSKGTLKKSTDSHKSSHTI